MSCETYSCEDCEQTKHEDDGSFSEIGFHCDDCREKHWAQMERQFGWMRRYVQDAISYERDGDHEAAAAIKKMCCS